MNGLLYGYNARFLVLQDTFLLFYFKINTLNALRNIFDDMRVRSVAL